MYYIYGQSGPSLLIESTDSMIIYMLDSECMHYNCNANSYYIIAYIHVKSIWMVINMKNQIHNIS